LYYCDNYNVGSSCLWKNNIRNIGDFYDARNESKENAANDDATEVIIKCPDKEIVITEPSVAKVNAMGQETFQISGQVNERETSSETEISEDDIKTVMEQSNVDEEKAREALKNADGDLAKAIMDLQK
jgi:nascent polypeptide-associated complex subunit alpha